MNIKFLALCDTFGYDQIGGTDSYMRRLSSALISKNYQVEWVFYGGAEQVNEDRCGIKIFYFELFEDALNHCLKDNSCSMVACYLKPLDKIKLIKLWWTSSIKFYLLSFFYPHSFFTKIFRLLEAKLLRISGVFCPSNRLVGFYNSINCKSIFLPPIVPNEYFKIGYEKAKNPTLNKIDKIRALFLGRLDPRKGISDVISLIKSPKLQNEVVWTVSGILIEEDLGNLEAYESLRKIDMVNFHKENRNEYSLDVESRVLSFFSKSDYFLQPYKSLSSTVDLPLLLLEAQAAGCIVITTLPQVLSLYMFGKSRAISGDFVTACCDHFLQNSEFSICQSKDDLDKLKELYCEESVVKNFTGLLNE